MTFRHVGNDIQRLLRQWLDDPESRTVVLQRTWKRAVGEKVSRRCRARGFEEGVLTVEVTDSSWAPQLEAMSKELITRVNAAIGSTWVRRIDWVQEGPGDVSGAQPRRARD